MGASYKVVDRWECDTKPERYPGLSVQAIIDDRPPPQWRVVVRDGGRMVRVRVVAKTEFDALQRVEHELPHVVVVLIEPM